MTTSESLNSASKNKEIDRYGLNIDKYEKKSEYKNEFVYG
jgi:hypothetical protein